VEYPLTVCGSLLLIVAAWLLLRKPGQRLVRPSAVGDVGSSPDSLPAPPVPREAWESPKQALVDRIPLPAAFMRSDSHALVVNGLWERDQELLNKLANDNVWRPLVMDVAKAKDSGPRGRVGDTHLFSAMCIEDMGRAVLLIAVPREPEVHAAHGLALIDFEHGLRTAWMRVKGLVDDVFTKGGKSIYVIDPEQRAGMKSAAEIISRSMGPVEDLVDNQKLRPLPIQVGEFLGRVRQEHESREPDFHLEVLVDPQCENLILSIRRFGIASIFRRLVENAENHGSAKRAWIVADATDPAPRQYVFLHFVDDGIGISDDARQVIEREEDFNRDPSEKASAGLGIGIGLCRAFAKQNLGMFELMPTGSLPPNVPPNVEGPYFRLTLPAYTPGLLTAAEPASEDPL
jgi:hypothetical protein